MPSIGLKHTVGLNDNDDTIFF